jgi:tetratricopeptide (TPR) repeat protein
MNADNAVRVVRVFVSSPSDVAPERGRVQAVAAKLNREYEGLVRFETVLWEDHFYKADRSFQPQIDRIGQPDACDVLASIFWTRVGTELPSDFARMPNGKPYPSGTAYELLTALEASKTKGIPDVYVFRKTADAALPTADLERRRQAQTQLDALEAFWAEWFKSEQGHFKAAFQTFASTDEFESQIEELLQQWLQGRHLLGPRLKWPKEKGSPFPGLAAFEAEHAAVFFGRDRAIDEARRRLAAVAASGTAFLLIVGASGSGKSSLARAGLTPRLTTPGIVETVDLWRVARMKPSDGQAGPVWSLASALFAALPELAQSDFPNADALADNLRRGGVAATRPVAGALARIAEAAQRQRHSDQPLRPALVLLIDQLEELFAQAVGDDERAAFAEAIKELVATGQVWCIATLRADLYEFMLKQPVLKAMKEAGASLDLGPPGAAELAEIVRAPAAAAGLVFENILEKGTLDQRLLADAKSAESLPLLQFTLRQLYEQRTEVDGETRLTHAAYDALGCLQGAIAAEAERAVVNLPAGTLDALPRLLRRLAEPARDSKTLTLRDVAQADVTAEPAEAALVQALLGARILIARQDAAGRSTLRLAHDAVLTSWPKAAAAAQASREFYRVRSDVEDALRRWQEHGQPKDRLIQPGVPLAEAEKLVADFGRELPADVIGYVNASRRQARLRQRLVAAAAVFFLLVAVLAGWQWRAAVNARAEVERQRDRAEHDLNLATEAANGLVRDLANKLRFATGVPTPIIKGIIEKARELQDQLISAGESTPALRWSQSAALIEYARALFLLGDLNSALKAAQQSNDIAKSLMTTTLPDTQWARVLMGSYQTIGLVLEQESRPEDALAAYREELTVAKTMTSKSEDDVWQSWRASADRGIGTMLITLHRPQEALAAYRESFEIRKTLAEREPDDPERQRDAATATNDIGDVYKAEDQLADALKQYREGNAALQALAHKNPSDTLLQDDLIVSNNKIGSVFKAQGKSDQALAAYRQARAIAKELVLNNPGNARWPSDLAWSTEQVAAQLVQENQIDEAISAYRDLITLRRSLASKNPGRAQLQTNLASAYDDLGHALQKKSDLDGALAAYRDSLAINRDLAKSQPENSDRQHDLAASYETVGDIQKTQGDALGAHESYHDALAIIELLANVDPKNLSWQGDLSDLYQRIGEVQLSQKDLAGALASYRRQVDVAERMAQADSQNLDRKRGIGAAYNNLGEVQLKQKDLPAALQSFQASAAAARRLVQSEPANSRWQTALAAMAEQIGSVEVSLHDQPAALRAYLEDLELRKNLARSDPGNTQWQQSLAYAYVKVAEVQEAQHDYAGALQSYRDAFAVRKRLTETDAANPQWQQDLALAYENIGDALKGQSDLAAALKSYRDGLAIRKHLTESDPAKLQWQREMAVTHNQIAAVQRQQGHFAEALSSYETSLTILLRMTSLDRTKTLWQDDVEFVVDKIGGLAFYALLGSDFSTALTAADQAIALAPNLIWLYTNRAHALMFLNRTDEARALYLKYRGQKIPEQDGKSWQAVILDDFAELRKARLSNPLMNEIEKDFASAG